MIFPACRWHLFFLSYSLPGLLEWFQTSLHVCRWLPTATALSQDKSGLKLQTQRSHLGKTAWRVRTRWRHRITFSHAVWGQLHKWWLWYLCVVRQWEQLTPNYSIRGKPWLKFNECQEQTDDLVCSHGAAGDYHLHCVLYSYLQQPKFSWSYLTHMMNEVCKGDYIPWHFVNESPTSSSVESQEDYYPRNRP